MRRPRDLTGEQCTPNTVHWTYDTYMLAQATGGAMVKAGGDTWFFITADYAFGHALENATPRLRQGQRRQGPRRRAPSVPGDRTSRRFLLQAQASSAKVIGLANAGADAINCIKQAAEFGINKGGSKLAALLMFITDVHSLGLEAAQGLVLTESFYWDLNDRTRAFTEAGAPRAAATMPNMIAGRHLLGVLHYLKAVAGRRRGQRRHRRSSPDEGDADRRRRCSARADPRGRPQARTDLTCSR